jgi:hypothetical protein
MEMNLGYIYILGVEKLKIGLSVIGVARFVVEISSLD